MTLFVDHTESLNRKIIQQEIVRGVRDVTDTDENEVQLTWRGPPYERSLPEESCQLSQLVEPPSSPAAHSKSPPDRKYIAALIRDLRYHKERCGYKALLFLVPAVIMSWRNKGKTERNCKMDKECKGKVTHAKYLAVKLSDDSSI